jgi:hypothetical protein
VEVIIFVFAVSVSLWFHNRSEHVSQQGDVKQFKTRLQSDISEMANDKSSYKNRAILAGRLINFGFSCSKKIMIYEINRSDISSAFELRANQT